MAESTKSPPFLVQTTLPTALILFVREQATAEGMSVATWLRRLILEKQRTLDMQAAQIASTEAQARARGKR